jgi:3-oxoacyl-[acyl-carrier-protein] synthase-3
VTTATPFVSLTALSVYLPPDVVTADDISGLSGLPAEVITDKLGLRQKHVAGADEHVSTMSVDAAKPLLGAVDADPASSAVIYFGSSIKDYDLWSCAVAVQQRLGLQGAYSFEVASNCAGFGVAVHIGRALLLSDPSLSHVWLVGASKEASVVDYGDLATKSVFAFADGAAAGVLTRDAPGLAVLSTAIVSDGTYNEAVLVPAGGTRQPSSEATVDGDLHKVRVQPDLQLGKVVGPQFIELMIRGGRSALEKAGVPASSIDLVVLQHQIPSVVRAIVDGIGATNARTVDLSDFGHMSSLDVPVALHAALEGEMLPAGGHALLLSAGLGYTWTATVVRLDSSIVLTRG